MIAVPSNIARLLVAYFTHTITVEEMSLLDEWITENETGHLQIFEECLEQSLQPQVFDPERDHELEPLKIHNLN